MDLCSSAGESTPFVKPFGELEGDLDSFSDAPKVSESLLSFKVDSDVSFDAFGVSEEGSMLFFFTLGVFGADDSELDEDEDSEDDIFSVIVLFASNLSFFWGVLLLSGFFCSSPSLLSFTFLSV